MIASRSTGGFCRAHAAARPEAGQRALQRRARRCEQLSVFVQLRALQWNEVAVLGRRRRFFQRGRYGLRIARRRTDTRGSAEFLPNIGFGNEREPRKVTFRKPGAGDHFARLLAEERLRQRRRRSGRCVRSRDLRCVRKTLGINAAERFTHRYFGLARPRVLHDARRGRVDFEHGLGRFHFRENVALANVRARLRAPVQQPRRHVVDVLDGDFDFDDRLHACASFCNAARTSSTPGSANFSSSREQGIG